MPLVALKKLSELSLYQSFTGNLHSKPRSRQIGTSTLQLYLHYLNMQSFLSTSTLITLLTLTSPFLPMIHAAKPASLTSTSTTATSTTGSSKSTDSVGSTGSSSGSLDSEALSQSSSSSSAASSSTAAAKSQWYFLLHSHLMIGFKSTHQWERSHPVPQSCFLGRAAASTDPSRSISYQPQRETS